MSDLSLGTDATTGQVIYPVMIYVSLGTNATIGQVIQMYIL